MAEAIVMAIFLVILLGLQIKAQQPIYLKAKVKGGRRILVIILSLVLLVIFWPASLPDQIKLCVFASMIVALGWVKEGLASDHLVKAGMLSGELQQFQQIQIETTDQGASFVTFYKNQNNHFSLLFEDSEEVLSAYFVKVGCGRQLILGEMPTNKLTSDPPGKHEKAR